MLMQMKFEVNGEGEVKDGEHTQDPPHQGRSVGGCGGCGGCGCGGGCGGCGGCGDGGGCGVAGATYGDHVSNITLR